MKITNPASDYIPKSSFVLEHTVQGNPYGNPLLVGYGVYIHQISEQIIYNFKILPSIFSLEHIYIDFINLTDPCYGYLEMWAFAEGEAFNTHTYSDATYSFDNDYGTSKIDSIDVYPLLSDISNDDFVGVSVTYVADAPATDIVFFSLRHTYVMA